MLEGAGVFSHRGAETYRGCNIAAKKEGTVPLSEHEQRLLDEIEQALYAEDPKFASAVRSARRRSSRRTSLIVALLCVGLGLGLVLVGLLATVIALSVVGFVLLVAGFVYGVQSIRHAAASSAANPSSPRAPRQGGVRGRMEDRLRRRFDEN
jgi:F0F1-type ATP synthase assembly protein I